MDWWLRIVLYLAIFAGGFGLGALGVMAWNFLHRRR